MRRYDPDKCHHLTADDHSVVTSTGRRRWTCTICGRTALWDEDWGYFGNVECLNCWRARIDYVVCSDRCAELLQARFERTSMGSFSR